MRLSTLVAAGAARCSLGVLKFGPQPHAHLKTVVHILSAQAQAFTLSAPKYLGENALRIGEVGKARAALVNVGVFAAKSR
jgi:hypothetical protein